MRYYIVFTIATGTFRHRMCITILHNIIIVIIIVYRLRRSVCRRDRSPIGAEVYIGVPSTHLSSVPSAAPARPLSPINKCDADAAGKGG